MAKMSKPLKFRARGGGGAGVGKGGGVFHQNDSLHNLLWIETKSMTTWDSDGYFSAS